MFEFAIIVLVTMFAVCTQTSAGLRLCRTTTWRATVEPSGRASKDAPRRCAAGRGQPTSQVKVVWLALSARTRAQKNAAVVVRITDCWLDVSMNFEK